MGGVATTLVRCACCGKAVEKPVREINRSRRLGRRFFCSSSCAAIAGNAPKKSKKFDAACPVCGIGFITSARRRSRRFCSRACASKGSVSEERREAAHRAGLVNAGNLLSAVETLKRREEWKYAALREHLIAGRRKFEFEFEIGAFVFDLALLDAKVIVEFDGSYHKEPRQREVDRRKDRAARKAGFRVIRRKVESESVFSPVMLAGL